MQNQDWNSQYIQHVDAKARADTIRHTVRAALEKPSPAVQPQPASFVGSSHVDGVQYDHGHLEASLYQGSRS